MKTSALAGLLTFLLGVILLSYDGGLPFFKEAFQLSAPQTSFATLHLPLMMSPMLGWFVAGMGAVLLGLKLQEKKWV